MRKINFPFSLVQFCFGTIGFLAVTYIALIAIVMNYAVLTVEFSQSVKNTEAVVASLEFQYLSSVASIQKLDYHAVGYAVPETKIFVPAKSMTALR